MRFLVVLLVATSAFAESPTFRAPDAAMAPALASGASYAMASVDALISGYIVVFNRAGQQVARRVVGTPRDRVLAIDPRFEKRRNSTWRFGSLLEDHIAWLHKDTPMNEDNPPVYVADLATGNYTIVLQMALSEHEAAPALGDSLFYVHADNRAQGVEDSREWGTVHARDFVGVILPAAEESQ